MIMAFVTTINGHCR